MSQENQRTIQIDWDWVWEAAGVGLRRASVFAGFGVNAALNPDLTDFDLPGLLKIFYGSAPQPEVVPGQARTEPVFDHEEARTEFRHWIISNTLREAVESLGVSLDRCYDALLIAESGNTRNRPPLSRFRNFHHAGIEGKLAKLGEELDRSASAGSPAASE